MVNNIKFNNFEAMQIFNISEEGVEGEGGELYSTSVCRVSDVLNFNFPPKFVSTHITELNNEAMRA